MGSACSEMASNLSNSSQQYYQFPFSSCVSFVRSRSRASSFPSQFTLDCHFSSRFFFLTRWKYIFIYVKQVGPIACIVSARARKGKFVSVEGEKILKIIYPKMNCWRWMEWGKRCKARKWGNRMVARRRENAEGISNWEYHIVGYVDLFECSETVRTLAEEKKTGNLWLRLWFDVNDKMKISAIIHHTSDITHNLHE